MALNTIQPPDNLDKYQNNYSYELWTANTKLEFCNVPWDNAYRDVVRFKDVAAQQAYFDGLTRDIVKITRATYCRWGAPVMVNVPLNRINRYNYLRVTNDYAFMDAVKTYYYFIQSCEYVAPNTTRIYVMLDVWQTFQFDVTFGRCYVERGHIGIANEHATDKQGRDSLDIVEGLDTGSEGMITTTRAFDFLVENANTHVGVLMVSTTNIENDPGDEKNPKLNTARGSNVNDVPNGVDVYWFPTIASFQNCMYAMAAYPWVSQGVVALWITPPLSPREESKFTPLGNKAGDTGWPSLDTFVTVYRINDNGDLKSGAGIDKTVNTIANFRDLFAVPDRYRNLYKFRMYPYAWVEMTMYNGNALIIKPQYVYGNDLRIHETAFFGAPTPRAAFYPENYANGEDLNFTVGCSDYPRLAIVNNSAVAYLASNAHSLAYGFQSADWANQKTQMGINQSLAQAQLSQQYNSSANQLAAGNRNATNAIATDSLNQQLAISNTSATNSANIALGTGIASGAVSAVGSLASGNVGGAVAGVANTAISGVSNRMQLSNTIDTANATAANQRSTMAANTAQANTYGNQTTALQNQQTQAVANLNADYARMAAKGDYANAIAGINAKIQDSKLSQPSISGGMGGDVMLYANDRSQVAMRFKQLPPSSMKNIGEYWLRFGYYVQRFVTPPADLACMEHFTYWKMQECYLSSSLCPEEFRQTIRGIFEKGVTVWKTPSEISTLDYADNNPLTGISY